MFRNVRLLGSYEANRRRPHASAPLTIALRQRDGETVRAPAEVLEVAADVRKRIDETGLSPLSTVPGAVLGTGRDWRRESHMRRRGVPGGANRRAHDEALP